MPVLTRTLAEAALPTLYRQRDELDLIIADCETVAGVPITVEPATPVGKKASSRLPAAKLGPAKPAGGGMDPEHKARIAEAMKAKWAERRAEQAAAALPVRRGR